MVRPAKKGTWNGVQRRGGKQGLSPRRAHKAEESFLAPVVENGATHGRDQERQQQTEPFSTDDDLGRVRWEAERDHEILTHLVRSVSAIS